MKSLYKTAMLAMVILPLTFSNVSAKQNGHGHHNNHFPLQNMLALVDLTSDQQANIDSIMQNYRSTMVKPTRNSDYYQKMLTIIKNDKFDSEQAKQLIANKNALRDANKLNRMQMTSEIYHSLTVEQQTKMDLLFEQYQQKMQKRSKRKGYNKGNN